jgi:hypothetical protein
MDAYRVDHVAPGAIPDITTMTNHELDIAMAYYRMGMEAGRSQGFDDGYRSAEEHLAAVQRQAVAAARAATSGPTYVELAERRGEPERAARARKDEQRIMSAPPVGSARRPVACDTAPESAGPSATPSRTHPTRTTPQPSPDDGPAPPEAPMEIAALNRIRSLPGLGIRPNLCPIPTPTPVHRPPAYTGQQGCSHSA